MRHNIEKLLNAHIADNANSISEFSENGLISDYLWHEVLHMDQGYCWYLTDEEIEEWGKSDLSAWRHAMSICDLIQKYAMPIEAFMLGRALGLYNS